MSLQPQPLPPIPAETARVAQAAFPRGTRAMRVRDELGSLYTDADFAALYPRRGQPAAAPWRLALILVLQYAEGLSDREAAEAVRGRIDWKYALSLPLTDPGLDASVLSEFRTRLVAGDAAPLLLDRMLDRLQAAGLLAARGRQRTDATHVLAKVRALNRLTLVGETMRAALNALAVVAPAWLRDQVEPAWTARYGGARFDDYRLPTEEPARRALAAQIGQDGLALLAAVVAPAAPAWLRQVPAVETLRQVWVQQYVVWEDQVRWRDPARDGLPPAAQRLLSPYDPDARWAVKRQTAWGGYKAHLTETCEPTQERPPLITHVLTTAATTPDRAVLDVIQTDLAAADRLPAEHLVDSGYVSAAALGRSQAAGVTVVGPVPADTSWQARTAEGITSQQFVLDWEQQTATCPGGRTNRSWQATRDRHGAPVVAIQFAAADCQPCPLRVRCTTATTHGRQLTVRPPAEQAVLAAARQAQATPAFAARYAARAGVEGTLSEAVQVSDLRHSRYRGLAKTHLQHVLTAAGLNLRRLDAWWADHPRASTRRAPWLRLLAAVA